LLTRKEKSVILEELSDLWKNAKSIVFYNFDKMLANEIVDFRKTIKNAGAKVYVYKNTLLKIGAKNVGIDIDEENSKIFSNQTGLIASEDDPLMTPRLIVDIYYRKGKPVIKGGYFEGRFISIDQVKQLAGISSKESMYQLLANRLISPATSLACGLNNVVVNLLNVLNAIKSKKEEIN
jgi:large subunit ribosomal protein L10